MRTAPVLVAVFTLLIAISGCRDKESRAQAPAAAGDRSASQSAPAANRPQQAESVPAPGPGNHRRESDAELLKNMK